MSIDATLAQIAHDTLGIETLETRGTDRLDFHEVAVSSLREALEAAYRAGREQCRRAEGARKPSRGASGQPLAK
jgi:hypothetical protein